MGDYADKLAALDTVTALPAGGSEFMVGDEDPPNDVINRTSKENRAIIEQLVDGAIGQNLLPNSDFRAWSAGASAAPDGWTLQGGGSIARSADSKRGNYAAEITYSASDTYLESDSEPAYAYFQGNEVTVGFWVKTSTAAIARVIIDDGVGTSASGYHTGGGAYELLEVTHTLDGSASKLTMELHVEGAGSAKFDAGKLEEGEIATAFSPHPQDFLPHLGYLVRAKFLWKDADEVYIDPGVYHHSGTTTQFASWASQITFQLGSGGSNAGSTDLGNNEFHYIYIDDSAVVTLGNNVLTASEFLNSTTAPTYNTAKHGWYNGSDRCIFAIRTNGSAQILEFFHEDNQCYYADSIEDRAPTDLDTTWIDVTLTIPGFTYTGIVTFIGAWVNGVSIGYWRTNGQSGAFGHSVYQVHVDGILAYNTTEVHTDSSQIIEVKHSLSNGNTLAVNTEGWLFPIGM